MKIKIKMPGKNLSKEDKEYAREWNSQSPLSDSMESFGTLLFWAVMFGTQVYLFSSILGLSGLNLIWVAGVCTWIIKTFFLNSLE